MSDRPPNPYIGPRAFEEGEAARFFGRERELEDLFHLLLARRLLLLHAPSGAGKSSLVRAALIPRLRDEGFVVHPVIRAGAEATAGAGVNRYVYASLQSLDEGRSTAERRAPAELTQLSLASSMGQRSANEDEQVFLFDQFEEVLSTDPADRAAKELFFAQLGALLEDTRRWALFVLREDYLGALKPYLLPIPTRLAATYRLDLLNPEQARRAMQGPARAVGIDFTDAAAQRLSDDLRRTTVQRPDGTSEEVLGQAVEPVQLQVVCYRLWERTQGLGVDDRRIDEDDLEAAGDVDAALAGYYAERVTLAAETGVSERAIREWVDRRLITEGGLRGQVLREPETTAGLPNVAIQALVQAHLLRAEERRGATWFELAHDRLIAPVRASNAAWREANLSPLQRQAALWEQQGRPDGLLIQGGVLDDAIRWAREHSATMTEAEHAFMRKAVELRERRKREEQANRRVRLFAWIAGFGGLAALILAIVAFNAFTRADTSRREAETQAALAQEAAADAAAALTVSRTAQALAENERARAEAQLQVSRAQNLAFQAQALRDRFPDLARLLAVEAIRVTDPPVLAARQALVDVMSTPLGQLVGGGQIVSGTLTLSAGGRYLAVAGSDGVLRVYDIAQPDQAMTLQDAPSDARVVSFSPDGKLLVVAGAEGGALAWPTDALGSPPTALDTGGAAVNALAFSPDGQLAVGCADGSVRWWAAGSYAGPPEVLSGPGAPVTALGFSADSLRLAAGDAQGGVSVWTANEATVLRPESSNIAPVEKVLVTSQGKVAALGAGNLATWEGAPLQLIEVQEALDVGISEDDGTVVRAQLDPRTGFILAYTGSSSDISGRFDEVIAQVISRSGQSRAGLRRDGSIRMLRGTDRWLVPAQGGPVSQLTFSDDEGWFAVQSADGLTRVWSVEESANGREPMTLRVSDYARSLAFGRDGSLIIAGAGQQIWRPGDVRPQNLQSRKFFGYLVSPGGRYVAGQTTFNGRLGLFDLERDQVTDFGWNYPATLTFSPQGGWLAASYEGSVRVRRIAGSSTEPLILSADMDTPTVAFSPDETLLAAGSAYGSLWTWRLDPPAPAPKFFEVGLPVGALVFSPDGGRLVVAGPSEVRIYARDNLAAAPVALPYDGPTPTLAKFSPDGAWLAVGGVGGVRIWELARLDGEPISVDGFEGNQGALAFSEDSTQLAIGTLDGPVLYYSTAQLNEEPAMLTGYPQRIYSVAFSPDGRYLAAGGRDTSARVWTIDRAGLIVLACESAGRNLTPDEWATYIGRDAPYRPTCP